MTASSTVACRSYGRSCPVRGFFPVGPLWPREGILPGGPAVLTDPNRDRWRDVAGREIHRAQAAQQTLRRGGDVAQRERLLEDIDVEVVRDEAHRRRERLAASRGEALPEVRDDRAAIRDRAEADRQQQVA